MKYIKPVLIILFVIALIAFTVNWSKYKMSIDENGPIISFGKEILEVSQTQPEIDYLRDVVAKDKKDGNITNKVVVESVSKFVDKNSHICNITYAVEDSDHNVSKKRRKIKFINYQSPRFTLSQPLQLKKGEDVEVRDLLGAVDKKDGDISGRIKILSDSNPTNASDERIIIAQVTNSLGETVNLKARVTYVYENKLAPTIHLKKNIVYVKKNSKFNERDYIDYVESHSGKKISKSKVKVASSNVNTSKPGCYSVDYIINEGKSKEGKTILTVVVED